jgi:hypothetical protein
MKLDPVLLNMACSWAMKAYNDKNNIYYSIYSET